MAQGRDLSKGGHEEIRGKAASSQTPELCRKEFPAKLCHHGHKRQERPRPGFHKQPSASEQLLNNSKQEDVRPLFAHYCTQFYL